MSWVCLDCGNGDYFDGISIERSWVNVTFDSNGNIDDWHDNQDSEVIESNVEKCGKCHCTNIQDLDGEELEEWKAKHFDYNNKFHPKGKKLKIDINGNLE